MMPQRTKGETLSVTSWVMCTGRGVSGGLAQMLTSLGNPDLLSPPSRAKFSSTNQGKLQCHACPPSLIRSSAKSHAVC